MRIHQGGDQLVSRNIALLRGVGWQKFFSPELVSLAQHWRTLQNPKQVSVRVKFVLLCRFNQAVDHRAGLSTCRSVGKEPVPSGAEASALIYTMVEMARANGVNVYQYLTYLLEKC